MSQQQGKPTILKDQKPIWMKCRASEACEGKQAIPTMLWSKALVAGGGRTIRYKCCTCNGSFAITV